MFGRILFSCIFANGLEVNKIFECCVVCIEKEMVLSFFKISKFCVVGGRKCDHCYSVRLIWWRREAGGDYQLLLSSNHPRLCCPSLSQKYARTHTCIQSKCERLVNVWFRARNERTGILFILCLILLFQQVKIVCKDM